MDESFPITSKLGENKAVLSDQDVDAQTYSKLFALTLRPDKDLAFKFAPSSFRHMNQRIQNSGGSSAFQADYFMTGQALGPTSG